MIEKISQKEINDRKVENMAMRPNGGSAYQQGGLSAADVRRRFDALALLAIAKYNELVEALHLSGDGSLSAEMPTGINGLTLYDLFCGFESGELAKYLRVYDDKGELGALQNVILGIYEYLKEYGDGATFTPYLNEDGWLEWTNDRDLDNPPPVNIKGKTGPQGEPGKDAVIDYQDIFNNIIGQIIDVFCPIGKVVEIYTDVSPASFLGGTWEQVKDVFLLAAGDTYAAGTTGGESAHILTENEMPAHDGHGVTGNSGGNFDSKFLSPEGAAWETYGEISRGWVNTDGEIHPYVESRGGSQPHNNMPPYFAVYTWRRIA